MIGLMDTLYLYTKREKEEAKNYRDITLLSSLGKFFTWVIDNRLTDWSEKYYVQIEAQADFRVHMSTVDDAFVLILY